MASAMRTPQHMFTVYDYSNDGDFFQETAAHHAVSAHDAYLAHLHGRERILMAIRRHPGAARSVDRDRNLGECRLEDHRVCYDADIRAKPCELYRLRPETAHGLRKRQRTKRRLLDDSCRPRDIQCQSRCDFPALRCPDTMYHRQKIRQVMVFSCQKESLIHSLIRHRCRVLPAPQHHPLSPEKGTNPARTIPRYHEL